MSDMNEPIERTKREGAGGKGVSPVGSAVPCDPPPAPVPSLYIDVQVCAGTDITIACRDACELAERIGMTVWFDFNGCRVHANPGTDWQRLVAGWYKAGADKEKWVRPL